MDLNKLAREIIEKNQYFSLATSDEKGEPWISPVAYTFDKKWNLYFISQPTSRHCKNIQINNSVALSIFDSTQLWGEGVGLQIEAKVEVLKLAEYPKVIKLYAFRNYPYGGINTERALKFAKTWVTERKEYKIYKVTPRKIWMNDPTSDKDERTEIIL